MVSKAALAAAEQRAASAAKKQAAATQDSAAAFEGIVKIAAKKVRDMESSSSALFSREELDAIPKFGTEELTTGKVLGKGGFGTVREIRSIKCSAGGSMRAASSFREEDVEQGLQDREFIAAHCLREDGDARYCVKALSPEVVADKGLFTQGVIDMAVETMFLSVVTHPHIIKMRAFGTDGMLKPNYYILLDRLYDTLEARIPKWRAQSKKAKGIVSKLRKSSSSQLNDLMETKLSYAYDLAGAFEYLHKKKLIYRDLKPENVGFNIRDDIVLFDFGLAREIEDKDKLSDHTWKLTGETGSLRYMAPEVAANKPYGYSADMYSFAIMLWEMLKMEKPYAQFNKKMHSDLVVENGGRPSVDDSWGPTLKGFLNLCWHQDATRRHSFARASLILKREASKVSGGSDLELNNFRRKSTFVNRSSLRERKSIAEKMNLAAKQVSAEQLEQGQ